MPTSAPPTCRLTEPGEVYRAGFLRTLRATLGENRYLSAARVDEIEADFAAYLRHVQGQRQPAGDADGRVPQATFWLVVDGEYGGLIKIRSELTPRLREIGGHIGYEIAPGWRGRGYGTAILALGLVEARALGLARVLLTCDEDNGASRRIIERNGGVCEGRFVVAEWPKPILRYWIHLD